jgi:hypothetical protein
MYLNGELCEKCVMMYVEMEREEKIHTDGLERNEV